MRKSGLPAALVAAASDGVGAVVDGQLAGYVILQPDLAAA